jgi:hypothetical protein
MWMYYYRARYHDAAIGRFISEDPMGFGAGDSNLYRYVGNSPTNFTDPTGNFALGSWVAPVIYSGLVTLAAVTIAPDAAQAPKSACDIKPGDNSLTRAAIEILGNLGLGIATSIAKSSFKSIVNMLTSPGSLPGGAFSKSWPVIDEALDPGSIKQLNNLSCGQACSEMLLRDRNIFVGQEDLMELVGKGTTYEKQLAQALNEVDISSSGRWTGLGVDSGIESIHGLNATGSWAAHMRGTSSTGHWIVVDGFDDAGRVIIRDPWQATRYKMNLSDFQQRWTGFSVWRY